MNTFAPEIQAIKDHVEESGMGMKVDEVTDPDDPRGICVMHFNTELTKTFYDAEHITVFRELSLNEQISCMVTGALTAMMAIGITGAGKDKADRVEAFVRESISAARFNAEHLIAQFQAETGCHV